MRLFPCGVGWNLSFCYWGCYGAMLRSVSEVWIKCSLLVRPSRVGFSFWPITDPPCVITQLLMHVCCSFPLRVCLVLSSHSTPCLLLETCEYDLCLPTQPALMESFELCVHTLSVDKSESLYCLCSFLHPTKADQHLLCVYWVGLRVAVCCTGVTWNLNERLARKREITVMTRSL